MLVSVVLVAVLQGTAIGGPFVRGDSNGDQRVDLSDAVAILQDLFLGGPALDCRDAGDFNDDGTLDIADVSGILDFLFLAGDPPPNPWQWVWPGWDPTPGDPFTCGDFPDELELDEEQLFDRLTGNLWQVPIPPSPWGTTYLYSFRRDGRYDWIRFSDAPEGSGEGRWNFLKTSPGGGMLILEEGEFLRFSFTVDGLFRLMNLALEPDRGPICPDGPCCETCTRSDLPLVPIPETVDHLTGRWRRTDDFNTGSDPTTIEFGEDGAYDAVFKDGICTASGFWSLLGESSFIRETIGHTCDPRVDPIGGPIFYGSSFQWEGAALVFDSHEIFLPDTGPPAEGRFRIEVGYLHGNSEHGRLEATYARPLAKSLDRFSFVLTAGGNRIEPWTLRVFGTPVKTGIPLGEKKVLGEIDLPMLEPRDSHAFSLDLDLRGAGELLIEFLVEGNDGIFLFPDRRVLSR
jgi:hypothetical protein